MAIHCSTALGGAPSASTAQSICATRVHSHHCTPLPLPLPAVPALFFAEGEGGAAEVEEAEGGGGIARTK